MNPCKDCQKREIGCHGKCEAYAKFREEKDKEIEARKDRSVAYYNPRITKMIHERGLHKKRR